MASDSEWTAFSLSRITASASGAERLCLHWTAQTSVRLLLVLLNITLTVISLSASGLAEDLFHIHIHIMKMVGFYNNQGCKIWKISSKFRKLSGIFWNLLGIFGKFPEMFHPLATLITTSVVWTFYFSTVNVNRLVNSRVEWGERKCPEFSCY